MKAKKKTWKDINLATAMELMSLEQQAPDMEPIDFIVERLAVLLDKDPSEVENQEPDKLFAQNDEWAFLANLPQPKFVQWTKLNGKEYGITPLDKLTLAQMVDIEEYYKSGLEGNIDKIASILVLPVKQGGVLTKKVLEDYEYDEERVEAVRQLDMEFVWQNILFFWTGVDRFTTGFRDYLEAHRTEWKTRQTSSSHNILRSYTGQLLAERQSRTLKGMLARLSTRSGAGSEQSTRSAEGI